MIALSRIPNIGLKFVIRVKRPGPIDESGNDTLTSNTCFESDKNKRKQNPFLIDVCFHLNKNEDSLINENNSIVTM